MTIEEFIITKGHLYSFPQLEREIGLPTKSLQRVKTGGARLDIRHRAKFLRYFKDHMDFITPMLNNSK